MPCFSTDREKTQSEVRIMRQVLLTTTIVAVQVLIGSIGFAQQNTTAAQLFRGVVAGKKASPKIDKTGPEYSELKRRWIVRSVRRDGKQNAAQIGQKVGDVIDIKKDGNNLALG